MHESHADVVDGGAIDVGEVFDSVDLVLAEMRDMLGVDKVREEPRVFWVGSQEYQDGWERIYGDLKR